MYLFLNNNSLIYWLLIWFKSMYFIYFCNVTYLFLNQNVFICKVSILFYLFSHYLWSQFIYFIYKVNIYVFIYYL